MKNERRHPETLNFHKFPLPLKITMKLAKGRHFAGIFKQTSWRINPVKLPVPARTGAIKRRLGMGMSERSVLYLIKPGELTLKGGNRESFFKILLRNLAVTLRGTGASITRTEGRIYVNCPPETEGLCEGALSRLAGISGWAKARKSEKSVDAVMSAAVEEALACRGARSFKVEARRTDKSFPLNSYEIAVMAGERILNAVPSFVVDVHSPEITIKIEIRERAYIYGREHKGLRGLPAGVSGRGMLLLSGGIDSPVAGYLAALRGMRIFAVYFHAYPYTPDEARQKAARLAEIVGAYAMGVKLNVVSFTKVEQRIKEAAPQEWSTVLLRMAMMDCASSLALRRRCKCLITGESLGQVASQTIENIACAESRARLPVLRPLIAFDKEDIIKKAVEIGSYETSILPYQDCCALFSPAHPVIHAHLNEASELYDTLDLEPLISEALRELTKEG
ncbi:MAG: tRNA 4-thiouridine(8) synthase ThiI [Spirochaetaceae bacterium]|jgi:thiamine biosynthesis protein ThiI|nr:tRNA 4-thiouridine(8) synthase ThiI [Spirochaetaceae bacterium]